MTRINDSLEPDPAMGVETTRRASAAANGGGGHDGHPRSGSTAERSPRLPPRPFVRAAWLVHRAIYRFTGGRRGLWEPKTKAFGTMRLTRSGGGRVSHGSPSLATTKTAPVSSRLR